MSWYPCTCCCSSRSSSSASICFTHAGCRWTASSWSTSVIIRCDCFMNLAVGVARAHRLGRGGWNRDASAGSVPTTRPGCAAKEPSAAALTARGALNFAFWIALDAQISARSSVGRRARCPIMKRDSTGPRSMDLGRLEAVKQSRGGRRIVQ
jgi:hypothetical protein